MVGFIESRGICFTKFSIIVFALISETFRNHLLSNKHYFEYIISLWCVCVSIQFILFQSCWFQKSSHHYFSLPLRLVTTLSSSLCAFSFSIAWSSVWWRHISGMHESGVTSKAIVNLTLCRIGKSGVWNNDVTHRPNMFVWKDSTTTLRILNCRKREREREQKYSSFESVWIYRATFPRAWIWIPNGPYAGARGKDMQRQTDAESTLQVMARSTIRWRRGTGLEKEEEAGDATRELEGRLDTVCVTVADR